MTAADIEHSASQGLSTLIRELLGWQPPRLRPLEDLDQGHHLSRDIHAASRVTAHGVKPERGRATPPSLWFRQKTPSVRGSSDAAWPWSPLNTTEHRVTAMAAVTNGPC